MAEPTRCAICGFPLQASREFGCVKGDCSMRPFPDKFYDFDRAEQEYGKKFDSGRRPAPAQATREQLASRVAALQAQLAKYRENRQVAQCVDCGAAIWFREARVEDESGTYHPLCRIIKQKAALEQRIAEAIEILDQAGDNRDEALAKLACGHDAYAPNGTCGFCGGSQHGGDCRKASK